MPREQPAVLVSHQRARTHPSAQFAIEFVIKRVMQRRWCSARPSIFATCCRQAAFIMQVHSRDIFSSSRRTMHALAHTIIPPSLSSASRCTLRRKYASTDALVVIKATHNTRKRSAGAVGASHLDAESSCCVNDLLLH
jgi:hypothetical protein